MGIRGLTTFIDSNPHLLSSHCLSDSQVVIDGNNLAHILYHDCKVDCVLGGDYNVFYKRAKRYFAVYKTCKISPFIIFDGGYDSSNRKLQTTFQRNIDRLHMVCSHTRGHVNRKIFPIMALEVFRDVLIELEIPFLQCDFEADDQIATLANHFNCPVLSLDSDFYIFDLKGGFIPLNTIDILAKKKKTDDDTIHYYLDCQIYYIDNFLQYFQGLDRSVLPLFGTVIGNDFVDMKTFNQFFDKIKLPKVKSKKLHVGQRQKRMIGFLWWLQSQTVDEAVEQIVGFLKAKEREKVKLLITRNVEGYTKCKTTLLQALGIGDADIERKPYQLKTKKGKALPKEFSELFFQAVLPPFMLNAVGLQRIFLLSQIEHLQSPSSYCTSLYIRKIIYGILLSKQTSGSEIDQDYLVTEYDRKDYNLAKTDILPVKSLPKFGRLPSVEELPQLSKADSLCLLCEVLGVDRDFYQFTPLKFRLPLMIIHYWACNSKPEITEYHVNTAIMILLYLMVFKCSPNNNNEIEDAGETINQILPLMEHPAISEEVTKDDPCSLLSKSSASKTNSQVIKKNLKKFFHKLEDKQTQTLDFLTLHGFAQYQTCLLFVGYLNRLLNFPLPHLQIEFVFNGTFMYKFCKELEKRPYPYLYISEMLGRDSIHDHFFIKIQKFLLEKIPKEKISQKRISTRKKKKKKEHANKCNANYSLGDEIRAPSTDGEIKMAKKIQSRVILENKFQELSNSNDSDTSIEFETLSSE